MIRRVPFHDAVAGIVTVGLLVGILLLLALSVSIPQYVSGAFTLAMGYTFRGAVQVANELRHRDRSS